jgi:hypothetical protein
MLSYALTTRQRLMDFMGITSVTTVQGNVIDRVIDSVTEYIERYCGRRFKKTTYTNELYDGDGSNCIVLNSFPVDSSSTFTFQYRTSRDNEDSWDTFDSDEYFVDYDAGIIEMPTDVRLARGVKIYRVTYTAGYDFDNVTTFLSDTEAGSVEYVAWVLASTTYNKRKASGDIVSERIGDYSVTYGKTLFESDDIKGILDGYKKLGSGGGLLTGNLYP